jgi:hypothetical protein
MALIASLVLLGRRSAVKVLSKDEARRIAACIAKLPELLKAQIKSPGAYSPGLSQVGCHDKLRPLRNQISGIDSSARRGCAAEQVVGRYKNQRNGIRTLPSGGISSEAASSSTFGGPARGVTGIGFQPG